MESREQSNSSNPQLSTESLSRPSAIVIGGGFAGIAAARALHDASFQVVLLESQDRIGGRVCTDYSFGFPVDMGASWLHGVCEENPLAPLTGRLGLPFYALFDTDGNQVPQELVTEVGKTFWTILKECMLICIYQEELLSGGHGLMVRGYHPVINTLAKGLDIRLNSRVSSISRRHSGVKVSVEDGSTFTADAAIVAPRLPQWKEKAISELGIGTENKIALHFDKVFWPNVEFLGVVASSSYGCSYFLYLHKATSYPVLVYICRKFAYMELKKILPDASEPINYLVSHWGTDINSLGSYSYHTVGKSNYLYERLRIPVDNIFFAGEATSMNYPGTVHGAFSTGTVAAEDCRMRVLEQYGELDLQNLAMDEEMSSLAVPLLISRM
ncbi:hypothetical protein MKX01_017021 [Papaver californicum]|nr:hypothetical protein MKX01_017021 [Papaver californicum]